MKEGWHEITKCCKTLNEIVSFNSFLASLEWLLACDPAQGYVLTLETKGDGQVKNGLASIIRTPSPFKLNQISCRWDFCHPSTKNKLTSFDRSKTKSNLDVGEAWLLHFKGSGTHLLPFYIKIDSKKATYIIVKSVIICIYIKYIYIYIIFIYIYIS